MTAGDMLCFGDDQIHMMHPPLLLLPPVTQLLCAAGGSPTGVLLPLSTDEHLKFAAAFEAMVGIATASEQRCENERRHPFAGLMILNELVSSHIWSTADKLKLRCVQT